MEEEVVFLKIDEIIPYDKNPRDNDAAVPEVANSMKHYGYNTKIEVNQNHVILTGHTRLKALKFLLEQGELGKGKLADISKDKIPVKVIKNLTKAEEKEYRLVDNKVAEKSGWKFDLVDIELQEIGKLDPLFEPEDFGFISDKYDEPPTIHDVENDAESEVLGGDLIDDEKKFEKPTIITIRINDKDEASRLMEYLEREGYDCSMD